MSATFGYPPVELLAGRRVARDCPSRVRTGVNRCWTVQSWERLTERCLLTEGRSQAVIISGESGAGKTEAAKGIMEYIAAVTTAGDQVIDKVRCSLNCAAAQRACVFHVSNCR